MKKLLFIIALQCVSFITFAQETVSDSLGCRVIDCIKFKNGIDTLEFTAVFRSFVSRDQDPILPVLCQRKQIVTDDYQNKDRESTYVGFMFPGCDKRFLGILNRNIYDRTFVRKHIGDFQTEIVDLNNVQTYQKVVLKCVVFEDPSLKDRRGGYFFEIMELRLL